MDSKPIKIDERMSRKIAGLGFVCACMVVGLHIHMDVAHMTCFSFFRAFFLRGTWARVGGGYARAENGCEVLLFRTCSGTFSIWRSLCR